MRIGPVQSRSSGFSILEMLVAIAVISLIAAVAIPSLPSRPGALRVETAARTTAAALRLARTQAIVSNSQIVVLIDVDRRSLQVSDRHTQLDRELLISMTLAAPERHGPSHGAIRFFPDGTASGAEISMSISAHIARISVNWLTGATRIDLGARPT